MVWRARFTLYFYYSKFQIPDSLKYLNSPNARFSNILTIFTILTILTILIKLTILCDSLESRILRPFVEAEESYKGGGPTFWSPLKTPLMALCIWIWMGIHMGPVLDDLSPSFYRRTLPKRLIVCLYATYTHGWTYG